MTSLNPTSRSEFLHARGLRHHIRRWGPADAEPLFLGHGYLDVSATFEPLAAELVRLGAGRWQVLAPDWRGFGDSEWPQDGYWFQDYVADLDAIVDHYAPGSALTLIGHSMGAQLVLDRLLLAGREQRRAVEAGGGDRRDQRFRLADVDAVDPVGAHHRQREAAAVAGVVGRAGHAQGGDRVDREHLREIQRHAVQRGPALQIAEQVPGLGGDGRRRPVAGRLEDLAEHDRLPGHGGAAAGGEGIDLGRGQPGVGAGRVPAEGDDGRAHA